MAGELRPYRNFLLGRLRANAPLVAAVSGRIFPAEAVPQGAAFPYVGVGFLSSVDRLAMPVTTRIFVAPVCFVAAFTQGANLLQGDDLFDLIDETLQGATGAVTANGRTFQVDQVFRRAQRLIPPDVSAGISYQQNGGEFESRVYEVS